MARRKPIIVLPQGVPQKMAEVYGVTPATIYNALSYSRNSRLCEKIRKDAVELYGGVQSTKPVF